MLQREGASIIVSDQMRLQLIKKRKSNYSYSRYRLCYIQNTMRQWLNILITLHYIYLCSDRCIIALSAMIILCSVSITWQHRDHTRLTEDRCWSPDQSEAWKISHGPIRSRHRASAWSDVRGEREQVLQHLLIAFIHEVLKTISQCRPIRGRDCQQMTNKRRPLHTSLVNISAMPCLLPEWIKVSNITNAYPKFSWHLTFAGSKVYAILVLLH